jgi:hypothetical protein
MQKEAACRTDGNLPGRLQDFTQEQWREGALKQKKALSGKLKANRAADFPARNMVLYEAG